MTICGRYMMASVRDIKTKGSFHAQSKKNCKDPPQILTKLGVFGVPMDLITYADF